MLPTDFHVANKSNGVIAGYINNLTPRDTRTHEELYETIAEVFAKSLPQIQLAYSYVRAVQLHLTDLQDSMDVNYRMEPIAPLLASPVEDLQDQALQVIAKLIDYELQPGQQRDSLPWHVEGMSHGEIVLTAVYILGRDEAIDRASIEFKRPFLDGELEWVNGNARQYPHPKIYNLIYQGLQPLGTVATPKGRLSVFPNSHVHRITTMLAKQERDIAKRRILVFILVNPQKRIISTADIERPQQETMLRKEAIHHQLEFMKERKFSKQRWNIREISLYGH